VWLSFGALIYANKKVDAMHRPVKYLTRARVIYASTECKVTFSASVAWG
jgi:hypothetical protein